MKTEEAKQILKTDRYGFPVQTCGRCGGSGQFSYNQLHGSVCYGCNGKGVRHTSKAAKQYSAWMQDLRCLREVCGIDLKVGDKVAVKYTDWNKKVTSWRTVTEILVTDKEVGWSVQVDGSRLPRAWEMTVWFDDGSVCEDFNSCQLFRRDGWIDPAPYIAKC